MSSHEPRDPAHLAELAAKRSQLFVICINKITMLAVPSGIEIIKANGNEMEFVRLLKESLREYINAPVKQMATRDDGTIVDLRDSMQKIYDTLCRSALTDEPALRQQADELVRIIGVVPL